MRFSPANTTIPKIPWIYHIVHLDKLESILKDGFLYSDAIMTARENVGTTIGISKIKERRLRQSIPQSSLNVGQCVPFYFCPRSPMLFVIHQGTHPELTYREGQAPILHLVFDPSVVAQWAVDEQLKFFITNENAACAHFDAWEDLNAINKLNWGAIQAKRWEDVKSEKAAEFLVENRVPISLLCAIGTSNQFYVDEVKKVLDAFHFEHARVQAVPHWYY